MKVAYSKNFMAQAKKLDKSVASELRDAIDLFIENPLDPVLRNHPLKARYKTYRSIDVSVDIRALYLTKGDEVIFSFVGTHSELYG